MHKTLVVTIACFGAAALFYLFGTLAVLLLEDGRQVALAFVNFIIACILLAVGLGTAANNSHRW